MRSGRLVLAALLLVPLAPVLPAGAYSGIGPKAVERALGRVPADKDELEREIDALDRELEQQPDSPELHYARAVLELNQPKSVTLAGPRGHLARAIGVDPGFADALQLWLDLEPRPEELEGLADRLRQGLAGDVRASRQWALALVEERRGRAAEAEAALDATERLDAGYHARVLWVRALLAAEAKDDSRATRLLLETLDNLDDASAELVGRNALYIANPEEMERYGSAFSEDRADFFRTFWKRRDPFPLTEANERFGEHVRRFRHAREEFAVRSNGRGYLTMYDVFKDLSPDLDAYASDTVFRYQERMPEWLDHRGLLYLRHGEPDRRARTASEVGDASRFPAGAMRSESWLYFRYTFKPLLFHLVERRGVDEYVITMNLAQAMVVSAVEDVPVRTLDNASGDFRGLYGSRAHMHPLFQRISISRTRSEIEDLLESEARLMAAFPRETWYDDTNNLIDQEDLLPFAAYSANFRGEGDKVDAFVYYAIPEKELKVAKGAEAKFDFDATMVLYSDNWSRKLASAAHQFGYQRPTGKKPGKEDMLVGALELRGLDPGRYNFAFQVTERGSGKIGIARGKLIADYYGPQWVDLSDLLLAGEVSPVPDDTTTIFERNGHKVVPIPTRTLSRSRPGQVYYEIYDLGAGADGKSHYQVEYRILQIQKKPSVVSRILSVGMNVAGAFFPYHVFLARAGLFGIDILTADEEKGLDLWVEERSADALPTVTETLEIAAGKYPPGIYQVYVTVKDHVTGSITTRTLRFGVSG